MDAVVRAVTAPLLDRIDEIMGRSTGVTTALEIARLLNDCRAEIARLRGALTEIAREDGAIHPEEYEWDAGYAAGLVDQAKVARAALRGE